jgi:hypothetical protein
VGSTHARAMSRCGKAQNGMRAGAEECRGPGKAFAGVKAAQWSQDVSGGGDGRWPGSTGTTCAVQRTGTLAWSAEREMWLASGPGRERGPCINGQRQLLGGPGRARESASTEVG